MTIRKIIPFSIPLLMTACTGSALFEQNSDEQVNITTTPSGASVIVMREELAQTPAKIKTQKIFPVTFPAEYANDYGRITLSKEGCKSRTLMVNATLLSQGVDVTLDCPSAAETAVAPQKSSQTPIKKRLQQLQALKDDGLINEDEYSQVRQRILDEL